MGKRSKRSRQVKPRVVTDASLTQYPKDQPEETLKRHNLNPHVDSPESPRLVGEVFWGISDLIYGGVVASLAGFFIPIETAKLPAVPIALVGLGLLSVICGALTLVGAQQPRARWSLRRVTWRVSVALAALIAVVGLLLTALCITSGLYWLGVFGVLGWGVFISSLLLLSGVIQLIVLYPLLKLRRLLSAPYRAYFRGGAVTRALLSTAAMMILVSGSIGAYTGALSEAPPLSVAQRDDMTRYLRSTLEGAPATPAREVLSKSGALSQILPKKKSDPNQREQSSEAPKERGVAPTQLASLRGVVTPDVTSNLLYVSFYAGGSRLARVSGRGHDLASATENAARALASHPKLRGKRLRGGRLVIDRVIGSAWIPLTTTPVLGPLILSLSIDPGRDGIRARDAHTVRTLLASDLVEGERFAVAPMVPGIPELRFGLDAGFIEERLGDLKRIRLERIRTQQWVEREAPQSPEEAEALARAREARHARGEPEPPMTALTSRAHWGGVDETLRLQRALPPRVQARSTLLNERTRYRAASHQAGAYLVRHQHDDGRFAYQYFPYRDEVKQPSDARYSIPRHSGAIYGLAMLYQDEARPEYLATARRAVNWLARYTEAECGGWSPDQTCIPKISSRGQVTRLGDNALSALALLKYLEVTDDPRAENIARGLLRFLLRVQRADGDFYHKYLLYDDSVVPEDRGMFASEQAAFSFVLAARRWPDGPWRDAARRALDALTVHKYGADLLSSFFYGADHWTCLAAYAAYPILKRREYLDFCLGYARFLQRLQYRYEAGEGDLTYHGHYGFGFLSPPQAPATGGFTEGVMGALLLAEAHGVSPNELGDLYAQVLASAEALTSDQIRPDGGWAMPNIKRAQGAFRRSLVESEVRVDFVQHSLSALLMTQALNPSIH